MKLKISPILGNTNIRGSEREDKNKNDKKNTYKVKHKTKYNKQKLETQLDITMTYFPSGKRIGYTNAPAPSVKHSQTNETSTFRCKKWDNSYPKMFI